MRTLPLSIRRFLILIGFPVLVIGLSFSVYLLRGGSMFHFLDQVSMSDAGENRYMAERFLGIASDPATYHPSLQPGSPYVHVLNTVPLREIGLGLIYLGVQAVAGDSVGIVLPFLMKVLMAVVLWTVYDLARRRWGVRVAVPTLIAAALPVTVWWYTDVFVTDAYTHLLFLCFLAIAIACKARPFRVSILSAFFLLSFLLMLLKVQWVAFGLAFFGFLFLLALLEQRWRFGIATFVLLLAVPLSMSLIHGVGWGDWSVAPGTSLHLWHKTHELAHDAACTRAFAQEIPEEYCHPQFAFDDSWIDVAISFPADRVREQIHALDREARSFVLARPNAVIADVTLGVLYSTNFPFLPRPFNFFLKPIDLLCWGLLLLGLTRRRTFLFAALGISMWFVAVVGNVFEAYNERYQVPAAGVVLALALLILFEEHITVQGGFRRGMTRVGRFFRQRWGQEAPSQDQMV